MLRRLLLSASVATPLAAPAPSFALVRSDSTSAVRVDPYVSSTATPSCPLPRACVGSRAPHARPVYAAGASPLGLTYVWRASHRVQTSLGSTGGFLWSPEPVPTTRAARFKYTATLDGGVRFASAAGPELALVYRFHHLSNANTAPENPAIASHVISASVGWHRARR